MAPLGSGLALPKSPRRRGGQISEGVQIVGVGSPFSHSRHEKCVYGPASCGARAIPVFGNVVGQIWCISGTTASGAAVVDAIP